MSKVLLNGEELFRGSDDQCWDYVEVQDRNFRMVIKSSRYRDITGYEIANYIK